MIAEERKLNWISKGLHYNFLYKLGKMVVNWRMEGYMKEALLYFLTETQAAFSGERPVVWCSTFIPSELVYALGGVPFMPEVAAGFAATVGLADRALLDAEGEWLNADLCSIHRCGTGLLRQGLVPEPDLILASSHLCDGAKKYLQFISRQYDCPYYLLETPYQLAAAPWLAEQIKSTVMKIAGRKVNFDQVFHLSNQAYDYHQQVDNLRRSLPAPHSGEHAMNLVPMEFMSFGSPRGVNYYRQLAGELQAKREQQVGVIPDEKYRLLWLHLKPYYSQKIFSSLRDMGAVIVYEEFSQLYWEPLNPGEPYLSLARKMISHFGWGEMERQLEAILKMIKDYQIDGVIGFSQWGCRQNSGRMGMIRRFLKDEQIPFLSLDGDLVDTRNYREGQLLTRLQAFLELINNKEGATNVNCRN